MKTWMALGGNQEPAEFDFGKWLAGEDIGAKRITGAVDTDIPFVHMDENADWFKGKAPEHGCFASTINRFSRLYEDRSSLFIPQCINRAQLGRFICGKNSKDNTDKCREADANQHNHWTDDCCDRR